MRIENKTRLGTILAAAVLMAACGGGDREPVKKTLVLGIDGLDPKLLQHFVDEGALPNFERLIAQGHVSELQTTMPPLSPIAWSTFITGMDPGGHGIYDFVHRDSDTIKPYMSMSRAEPPSRVVNIGTYSIPLDGGRVDNLRKGRAFWQILEENDVPTVVFRMPANYPPAESPGKAFSGMGTPDILGTSGTFSFYTDLPLPGARNISGGEVYMVEVRDDHVSAKLHGPENSLRRYPKHDRRLGVRPEDGEEAYGHPPMTVDFDVWLDPDEPFARFQVGDEEFILRQGEWSDWIPVTFDALPVGASVGSIGRFYLKQVRPDFQLYVSPLQIDPADPAQPISTPEDWSVELFDNLGRFYTQELPEDTKALTHGVFTGPEFWDQAQFVYRERRHALDYFLDNFDSGLLFFYFSSVDQGCHMLWRYVDEDHPGYMDEGSELHNGIRTLYEEMDESLGRVMAAIDDDTTLIVMSDHGFCPFYWQVNLNTWLLEKGYVTLKDPSQQGRYPMFLNVDWSKTRAYALGLNGLYVNLSGREADGIVRPEDYDALLDDLERDLLELEDPRNGRKAVTLVTRTHRDFHGPYLNVGPDIIVGYNWGYRSSWTSPLGEFPKEIFIDNKDAWSGDHSVDYRHVPGVLLTNREITMDHPALYDLTVAILDEYGIDKLPEMIGRDCLGSGEGLRAAAEGAESARTR